MLPKLRQDRLWSKPSFFFIVEETVNKYCVCRCFYVGDNLFKVLSVNIDTNAHTSGFKDLRVIKKYKYFLKFNQRNAVLIVFIGALLLCANLYAIEPQNSW